MARTGYPNMAVSTQLAGQPGFDANHRRVVW
jgi:hypothetical protein